MKQKKKKKKVEKLFYSTEAINDPLVIDIINTVCKAFGKVDGFYIPPAKPKK